MTLAAIERRLNKLEIARRPPRGLFFAAWGHVPAEIEAALSEARSAGTIADGDPVVRSLWPADTVPPEGRWVCAGLRTLDFPEFDALMGEVDRFTDDWHARLRTEALDRRDPVPNLPAIESEPEPAPTDDRAAKLCDAALFAAVLAVPLAGTRPALTDDRAWRVTHCIETLGLRDRIRGRGRVAAIPGATRH